MNHTKIWDGTKELVFVRPLKNTVDLTANSNSEIFPVDANNYEARALTKYPIETAKLPTSATTPNEVYKP